MARVPLEPAAIDRPRNCAPPCGKILARCVAAIEGRELQARPILYSEAYKRVVTLLLMAAYTFNSMDRSIISIIASPMKLDLELTDTELGCWEARHSPCCTRSAGCRSRVWRSA
jgi:hypothetical protein